MAPTPIVSRDEIVSCPKCERSIAKIRRDLYKGERITSGMFEPMAGVPVIMPNTPAKCPSCETYWLDGSRIHMLGRGWV